MKIDDIVKILEDKKITIEYLYEQRQKLIENILSKPQLIKEIEEVPDAFWEGAKETGLLFYSDSTHNTDTGEHECISNRKQDFINGKKHVHAIVLQKQKWR